MAKFLISCRPASYGKFSMHAFEHLPEIGVNYVEIDIPSDENGADLQIEMLEELGLKALSLCFPINVDDKKIVEKFENAIPVIKKFDPMFIFSSVKIKKEKKREKGYSILKEIGNIAEKNDLFISVETHPHYNTNGDRGKETMENVNSNGVKINYDTANIYYYNENVDGKEELKKVLPWIGSIHIKESNKLPKTWDFPTIGEGKVDFPGILKMLNDVDQTIPLTLEIEGVKGESLDLEQTKNRIKASVEYLENIISNL